MAKKYIVIGKKAAVFPSGMVCGPGSEFEAGQYGSNDAWITRQLELNHIAEAKGKTEKFKPDMGAKDIKK